MSPRLDEVALKRETDGFGGRYRVDLHPQLGIPTFLQPTPAAAYRGAPLSLTRPEVAARRALRELAPMYDIAAAQVDGLIVKNVQPLENGAAIVQFTGAVDGIEVYQERASVLMNAEGSLRAVGGYVGSTASVPPGGVSMRFKHSPREAMEIALGEHFPGTALELQSVSADPDQHGYVHFLDALAQGQTVARGLRAKRVLFRMSDRLVAAHYLEIDVLDAALGSTLYGYVVSAEDDAVLMRQSLTHDAAFGYRVWADPLPPYAPHAGPHGRGGIPHPTGIPNGFQPSYTGSTLISLQNGPISTNDPWLPFGAGQTFGNNVDAYADLVMPDGWNNGDQRAFTTSAGVFDRAYNLGSPPGANAAQIQAAVTQLFYLNNWLHDWYYDAGFDEAAGNAQFSNLGRGGIENDRLLAQAQDYSSTDNAHMSTPADGASPRMQTYVFTAAAPDRDSSLDGGVVAHEWGHYIATRLIGNFSTSQTSGLGEGWSDFHSLLLMVRAGDDAVASNAAFTGAYAIAGYATGGAAAPDDSFYFGIRRYPYSTSFQRNPLTFRHIANGQAFPAGVPINGNPNPANNAEPHNVGEVWASMLWGCYAGLLADKNRLSFDQAQDRMKRYLVASYKLTPLPPSFVTARDALLSVIRSQDEQDFLICAQAFAARGLGSSAVAPIYGSQDNAGLVESFTLAPRLIGIEAGDQPGYCDADGFIDPGETGTLRVMVGNGGVGSTQAGTVTLSSTADVSFPTGHSVALPALEAGEQVTLEVPVTLESAGAAPKAIAYEVNIQSGGETNTASASVLSNIDYRPQAGTAEDFEAPGFRWDTLSANGAIDTYRWRRRELTLEQHTAYAWAPFAEGVAWLISPSMPHTPGTAFSFKLRHRHSFEVFLGKPQDGGLIEVNINGSQNWTDLEAYTSASHYDGTIENQVGNPMQGRKAFSGDSAGYPAFTERTFVLDDLPSAAGNLRIRFGVATSINGASPGWEIDAIETSGLNGTPFDLTSADQATCQQLELVAGTPQVAAPGAAFPQAFEARVRDAAGIPQAGVKVYFDAPQAGASGSFPGGEKTAPVFTDVLGIAKSAVFTANSVPGDYVVSASAGLQSADFQLGNRAGIFSDDFEN